MRHEPFGPEGHDHHQSAKDSHDGERAERATNQTQHHKMCRLEPMDDPGRTYLHWSPDLAGMCRAADRKVEKVEHPEVHRKREQRIAGSDDDRDDPLAAPPSPVHADDASSRSLLSRV